MYTTLTRRVVPSIRPRDSGSANMKSRLPIQTWIASLGVMQAVAMTKSLSLTSMTANTALLMEKGRADESASIISADARQKRSRMIRGRPFDSTAAAKALKAGSESRRLVAKPLATLRDSLRRQHGWR